ncbi:MAG: hypothetical protein NZ951_06395 [Dehalococcoidia bacterium]|nr:hypothetical protein [Dehalococcoidia bacterium]MDW8120034.1 hypothetical protein [Chloroflexota bacterium]
MATFEERVARQEGVLEQVNERLGNLERGVDALRPEMGTRFEAQRQEMTLRFEAQRQGMINLRRDVDTPSCGSSLCWSRCGLALS